MHRSGFKLLAIGLCSQLALQVADAADCIPLTRVDIEANPILDESGQRLLMSPFIGACIDAGLTRKILSSLSSHFIDGGYVTTRPYLLEQDISDGQLEIRILVGKIEAIVDAETGAGNSRITTAFLFNDEILNLRELETSLETIERVASVSAAFEIRPGSQQGGSIVAIDSSESKRFRSEFGVNAQTELEAQLSFRATLDNLFNINDIVEFRFNSGEVFQSYQSNRSRELIYSFGLGGYLLTLIHSDISFSQRVQGINDSFLSAGETLGNTIEVSKLLTRNQTGKLNLGMALELKDSKNFFDDQLIDVSSYKTSQLRLELRHDWLGDWGQLVTRYNYHQGLDSYGARDDEYFTLADGAESEARLQFEKFTVDSQLRYYLPNPAWNASLQLHLQYSDDILFDNDKLVLGSPSTVRGYSTALSGGIAWYFRADLGRRLQTVVNPFSGKALTKTISISAGIDYGEVKCEIDNVDLCGDIYSLGLGIDISDANFFGRLQWGHPLKKIDDDVGDEDIFLLDLRWSL